jgi:hypothetical protein
VDTRMSTRRPLLALVVLAGACATSAAPVTPAAPVAAAPVVTRTPAIDPAGQDAIDAGVLRLFADEPATRIRGAETIAALGPRGRSALKYLIDCMMHDDAEVVAAACSTASVAIGPGAADLLASYAASDSPRAALAARALAAIDDV